MHLVSYFNKVRLSSHYMLLVRYIWIKLGLTKPTRNSLVIFYGENTTLLFYCCNAVCPGGEEAVLKIVGRKRLVGSNPVYSV